MSRKILERSPIVAVPVRDEADRLPKLLRALARQSWISRTRQALPVMLVLNNCRDQSRAVATRFQEMAPELCLDIVKVEFPADSAHVGTARRLAMDRAD